MTFMNRYFCLLFLSLGLIVSTYAYGSGLSQPVRVESGLLSGVSGTDSSVTVFKGVPFAAPPVGDLRWRAPHAPERWQGVRKASQFGANCVQEIRDTFGPWTYEYQPHGQISEDCLFLNIWTPARAAKDRLPVLVYIPGGAFTGGSGSVAVYDGESLAKRGIVMVTINYRVGVFGFFAHPELTKESEQGSSGNYGLLDQLAALQWVKRNIAAFGGDPKQVTIMGQSAGASSVHYLTASPLAKGLFVRAIADSGSSLHIGPGMKLRQAEQSGVRFAELQGAHSLQELRALPMSTLMNPAKDSPTFRPIVDGWFLPDSVEEIFAQSRQNDVPTLTGFTLDEGSSSDSYGKLPADQFRKAVSQQAGHLADRLLTLYPTSTPEEVSLSQKQSARDSTLVGMHLWATRRARVSHTKTYTYLFTHPTPGPTQERYGVFHSSELPYVFDNLKQSDHPWTPQDHQITQKLSAYWVNFIKTGDPNGTGLPEWPAFNPENTTIMELGDKMSPRPVVEQEKFKLLRQLIEQ
jgi:para-nitrobenzyl esterase